MRPIVITLVLLFTMITFAPQLGTTDSPSETPFQCSPTDGPTTPPCEAAASSDTKAPTNEAWVVSSIKWFVDVVLHLDRYLNQAATALGPWVYLLVFMVIFLETGVVIFPFLPGDSFLFALGALTAVNDAFLRLDLLIALTFVAAVLGDALNYTLGRKLGPVLFLQSRIRFLNRNHLEKTQRFYEKHGAKTIVIARFAPIIRTFAPFVAGIGQMQYRKFLTYNLVGGAAWVMIFLVAGSSFGNLPAVKRNFHYVIFGIIAVSLFPLVIEWWKSRHSPAPSRNQ